MSLTQDELNALPIGSIIAPYPYKEMPHILALKITSRTWTVTGYTYLVPTAFHLRRFSDEWELVNVRG